MQTYENPIRSAQYDDVHVTSHEEQRESEQVAVGGDGNGNAAHTAGQTHFQRQVERSVESGIESVAGGAELNLGSDVQRSAQTLARYGGGIGTLSSQALIVIKR
jgi:hypothetical protein